MDYKIRIDDYPWVTLDFDFGAVRQHLATMCRIFNEAKKSFLIGVIPFVSSVYILEVLAGCLGEYGRACLHGSDHLFRKYIELRHDFGVWTQHAKGSYAEGGEFAYDTFARIKAKYEDGNDMLTANLGDHYDPSHYICPFNCYNQMLLDALNETGKVKYLHTCDAEYVDNGSARLAHNGIRPVVATYHDNYDFARAIVERIRAGSEYDFVVLHWAYDIQKDAQWTKHYQELAGAI